METTGIEGVIATPETDHAYSRAPLRSGSISDNPASPSGSESSATRSSSGYGTEDDCAFSNHGTSPRSHVVSSPDPNTLSPLGTGIEDLDWPDIDFGSLDTSSLLEDQNFIQALDSLSNDTNITVDLGEWLVATSMDYNCEHGERNRK